MHMRSWRWKRSNCRGATMVEIAMALPLFLLVAMILIWIGLALNAKSALKFSMEEAMRLARARAEHHTIRDLEIAIAAENNQVELLRQNVDASDASAYYNARSILNPINFSNTPPWQLYALVLTYEAMKKSIGSGLRFPCEADVAGGEDCLACQFLVNEAANYFQLSCSFQPSFFLLTPVLKLISLISGGEMDAVITFNHVTG